MLAVVVDPNVPGRLTLREVDELAGAVRRQLDDRSAELARVLLMQPDEMDPRQSFMDLGVDSVLGVEFVRDRVTLEPATEETMAICDRMLELGVVIQPTGDRMCVLKIKPPLCLDVAGADFFADTLDQVLREGW